MVAPVDLYRINKTTHNIKFIFQKRAQSALYVTSPKTHQPTTLSRGLVLSSQAATSIYPQSNQQATERV
mgnify:CR=1 FL=1